MGCLFSSFRRKKNTKNYDQQADENNFDIENQNHSRRKSQGQNSVSLTDREKALKYKEKGNAYFKNNQLKQAIQEYTLAIELYPEDSIFFSNRALCQKQLQNWSEVFNDCQRALEIDEFNFKAYNYKGVALVKLAQDLESVNEYNQNMEKAIELFQKAKTVYLKKHKKQNFKDIEEKLEDNISKVKYLKWERNQKFQQERIQTGYNLIEQLLQYNDKQFTFTQQEYQELDDFDTDRGIKALEVPDTKKNINQSSSKDSDINQTNNSKIQQILLDQSNNKQQQQQSTNSEDQAIIEIEEIQNIEEEKIKQNNQSQSIIQLDNNQKENQKQNSNSDKEQDIIQLSNQQELQLNNSNNSQILMDEDQSQQKQQPIEQQEIEIKINNTSQNNREIKDKLEIIISEEQIQYNKELLDKIKQDFINPQIDLEQYNNIPEYYRCAITYELLNSPSISQAGFSYDSKILKEHFAKNGNKDPITRKPVDGKYQVPNQALQKAVMWYKDKNPWYYKVDNLDDFDL